MRIVLDTNVLILGIFFTGPPSKILAAWAAGGFDLIASVDVLAEYRRVGERLQRQFPTVDVQQVLDLVTRESRIVEAVSIPLSACSDPNDLMFLGCAIAGQATCVVSGDRALLRAPAMSPDGTRIASGGRDGYVRLWDTTHFDNVAQLGGHTSYIYSLAWSPDGRQLISSSGDHTVRIWDTRTLAEEVGAVRARTEALPPLEARVARARADAPNPGAAVATLIASPEFDARQRELVQQVAMRFALDGMPRYYRAPRAATPIVIDGRIDEAAWNASPWSELFVDIEGDGRPRPRFATRMRMLWDDTYLYVAARLEEPHVWATLSKRDDIVVWRINFSRVEWQHHVVERSYVKRYGTREDNWVWTPQHVLDMHRPREWGFVEFVRDSDDGQR